MKIDNFNNIEILVTPLKDREDRFYTSKYGNVTTGAFTLHLAKDNFLLVEHGGGKEIFKIGNSYQSFEYLLELCKMDERTAYGLLFTMYNMASEAEKAKANEITQKLYSEFSNGTLYKRNGKIFRKSSLNNLFAA